MSKWDSLWKKFDDLMAALPGAIKEAVEEGRDGVTTSVINNGDVVLRGKFRSLRINGYKVRVPDYVLKGNPK